MKAFSEFHPAALLTYFLSVLIVAMFVSNPIISLLALAGASLFCLTLTDRQEKKRDSRFYILLFFLITVTNPLFSHSGATPLFFINGSAVTLEAVFCGAQIALMMISVMLWCKAYSFVMTEDKFVFIFGRAAPKISLVLSAALRYVPMLKRRAREIKRSQKAIGLYSSAGRFDRVRSSLRVFSSLISQSLESAVETSRFMKAQGYGEKKRTFYHEFRFGVQDLVLLLISVASLSTVIIAGEFHKLDFFFYPSLSGAELSPAAAAAYAAFGIISFLPFIVEIFNELCWKYSRSKI